MPCRPSSSGGATLRRAMSERCACTPRAPPQRPNPPLSCPGCRPQRSGLRHPCLDGADDAGAEYLDADTLLALWDEMGAAFAASLAGSGADLQTFLKNLNPPGTWSGGCISIWRKTGAIRSSPSPSWRPTPPGCRPRPKPSMCRSARPCANTPERRTGTLCCRCSCRFSVPRNAAAGSRTWSMPGDFSSPALVPGRGRAIAVQRTRPGKRRCGGAHACLMARQPSGAPTGHGDGWRPTAVGHRSRRIARFPHGRDAGRRAAQQRGNRQAARRTDTLVLLRGQWVEIDRRRLERAMRRFKNAQALAERDGLTFIEAMRLLAGAAVTGTDQDAGGADWSQVTAGPGWPRR